MGEAEINFAGMDKLHGIEKVDFLDDAIGMLERYRQRLGTTWANDYENG